MGPASQAAGGWASWRRWFSWGRKRGGSANPATVLPEEHCSFIVVPDTGEAGLVAAVSELRILDHGTGLGTSIIDLLGLDELAVDDVTEGWNVVAAERFTFSLHAVACEPDRVGVSPFGANEPTQVARSEVADLILSLLTRRVLDTQDQLSHLHGGAVVDPDGRLVLILGRSGAGKSTLTAHLAATGGWRLVTDEQVALFPDQRYAGGFTRPVAIKRLGFGHVPPAIPPSEELGSVRLLTSDLLGCGRALAARPALIVLPERDDGVDDVTWELLEPAAAVEELCANNLDMVRRPAEALRAFGWLASTTPTVRLSYREAADVLPAVSRILGTGTRIPLCEWSVAPAEGSDERTIKSWDGPGDRSRPELQLAPKVDALAIGNEVVLFRRATRELVRLNAAASQWLAESVGAVRPEPSGDLTEVIRELQKREFLRQSGT